MEVYNERTQTWEQENAKRVSKVFFYMAAALGITALISWGLPYLLVQMNWLGALMPMTIVSGIGVLVITITIQFKAFNTESKAVAPLFWAFAVCMGVSYCGLFLAFESQTLFLAFASTAISFLVMGLYGFFTKKNLMKLSSILFVGLISMFFISIVNIFMKSSTVDWVISIATLGIMLIVVAMDMQRLRVLNETNNLSKNLAYYMALNLYVDFIYIFIRILSLLQRSEN